MHCRFVLVVSLAFATPFAFAADHRDAPLINYDATADLNDLYVFANPNDPNRTVLALTVNPFSAPGNAHSFAPDVLYQFKIDNTGDFQEDLVIQATFTAAVPGVPQRVTVHGPTRKHGGRGTADFVLPRRGGPMLNGPTGAILSDPASGVRVFTGLRDDPFFFDSTATAPFLGLNALPTPARSPLGGGSEARDFFGGFNVTALVIELPNGLLRGATGDMVRIWATTSRQLLQITNYHRPHDKAPPGPWVQIERTALPGYNTVFIPNGARGGYDLKPGTNLPNPPSRQDAFNRGVPANDATDFFPDVLATAIVLDTLGNLDRYFTVLSNDPNDTILARIQRDVATFELGNASAGFEALNGRRLADDVIDVLLALGSGIGAAADGVSRNDVAAGVVDPVSGLTTDTTGFLPNFPFLAPPKLPNVAIAPRGGN